MSPDDEKRNRGRAITNVRESTYRMMSCRLVEESAFLLSVRFEGIQIFRDTTPHYWRCHLKARRHCISVRALLWALLLADRRFLQYLPALLGCLSPIRGAGAVLHPSRKTRVDLTFASPFSLHRHFRLNITFTSVFLSRLSQSTACHLDWTSNTAASRRPYCFRPPQRYERQCEQTPSASCSQ